MSTGKYEKKKGTPTQNSKIDLNKTPSQKKLATPASPQKKKNNSNKSKKNKIQSQRKANNTKKSSSPSNKAQTNNKKATKNTQSQKQQATINNQRQTSNIQQKSQTIAEKTCIEQRQFFAKKTRSVYVSILFSTMMLCFAIGLIFAFGFGVYYGVEHTDVKPLMYWMIEKLTYIMPVCKNATRIMIGR